MAASTIRVSAILLICLLASVGCSRPNNAEVTQARAEAEAARAEAKAAKDELAKAKADADTARAELSKLRNAQTNPIQVTPATPDRKAAEWVLRCDGSVQVVADGVSLLVKKDEKLPDSPFKVVAITLNSKKASDDGTAVLHGLKDLRSLDILDTDITKLEFVGHLQALEKFRGTISDAQLSHLKGLAKLNYLTFGHFSGNPKLTDAGLEMVKDMKQLEVLGLFGCNITDVGLKHLEGAKALKLLELNRTQVTDAGLEHLKGLTNLEDLRLGGSKVTEGGVKKLQAALPKCQISK